MKTQDLRQVILTFIEDYYGKKYIGKLRVTSLPYKGYKVEFGMNTPDQPMVIQAELDDDKFLSFIKEEIKAKRFDVRSFGQVNLRNPYSCESTSGPCCEKG